MKTPKNTQNADMPTKDTRQCNNTPKPLKRHIRKIFAFVACLLLMVNIAIPCFATGWQIGDSLVYVQHPYAPSSIAYYNGDEFIEYTCSSTYPVGDRLNSSSNNSMSIDGVFVSGNMTTYYDYSNTNTTIKIRSTIGVNTNQFPVGSVNRITVTWGSFAFTRTDRFPEYFSDSLLSLRYNTPSYYRCYLTCFYYDPIRDSYGEIEEFATITQPSANWSLSYIVRSGLNEYMPQYDCTVIRMSVDVVPITSPTDDTPVTSTRLSQVDIDAHILDDTVPTETLLTHQVEYLPAPPTNASGLFTWIIPTVQGIFNTPLIPIGDFSISVGALVGMTLGLLLLFALLRFFSGG